MGGDPSILTSDRSGRLTGPFPPYHVPGGKDVRYVPPQVLVHHDLAVLTERHPCVFNGDLIGIGAAPGRDELPEARPELGRSESRIARVVARLVDEASRLNEVLREQTAAIGACPPTVRSSIITAVFSSSPATSAAVTAASHARPKRDPMIS